MTVWTKEVESYARRNERQHAEDHDEEVGIAECVHPARGGSLRAARAGYPNGYRRGCNDERADISGDDQTDLVCEFHVVVWPAFISIAQAISRRRPSSAASSSRSSRLRSAHTPDARSSRSLRTALRSASSPTLPHTDIP